MGVFVVILLALLVAIFLLAFNVLLPVRFRFHGEFAPGRAHYRASIRLPLIPWYVALPDFGGRRRPDPKATTAPRSPPEREGPQESIWSRIDTLRGAFEMLMDYYPKIAESLSYLARAIVVEELRFHGRVGTGDACDTALLTGALGAAAGIAVTTAQRKGIRFRQRPAFRITPVYDRTTASAEVQLAASIAPWRTILVAYRLYRQFRKVKAVGAKRRVKGSDLEY